LPRLDDAGARNQEEGTIETDLVAAKLHART
jgi:hypothetical protein